MALNFPSRSYAGGAVPTTLASTISAGAGTGGSNPAIVLNTLTGWVEITNANNALGTSGGYVLAIDYGLPSEEKIFVPVGVTGTSLSNSDLIRGYDGTTATTHSANAVVAVVWSANEAAEASSAASAIKYVVTNAVDSTPTGLIANGGGASTTLNGTANTVARADHWHNIPDSVVTNVVTPTYIKNNQNNTFTAKSVGSGTTTLGVGSGVPTGPIAGSNTTSTITGITRIMWIAKFQWDGGTSANAQEVTAYLFASTNGGGSYTQVDYAASSWMPVQSSANNMCTFVGHSVVTGLTASSSYTFAVAIRATSTTANDRTNFSHLNLSVIGIS